MIKNVKILILPVFILLFPALMQLKAQRIIADYSLLEEKNVSVSASPDNATRPFLTDKQLSTAFVIKNFSAPAQLQFFMPKPVVVKGISLVSADNILNAPGKLILKGSNDGKEWLNIGDTIRNPAFPGKYQSASAGYSSNKTPYQFYRLLIYANRGGTDLSLAELQLFGYPATLSSDLTNTSVVTATAMYSGVTNRGVENLMNDNLTSIYRVNTVKSCWIQYDLEKPVKLDRYSLMCTDVSIGANPRSWKLSGSNDGGNWEVLDVRSYQNFFKTTNNLQIYKTGEKTNRYDWAKYADSAQKSLIDMFWRNYTSGKYLAHSYHANSAYIDTRFDYWWLAHALEVFVDGYARTGNADYLTKMNELFTAVKKYGLKNNFYDDMEWMAIACLRVLEVNKTVTHNWKNDAIQLWNWILPGGWTDTPGGGGVLWVTNQTPSKNACSNAPAIILSARLYNLTKEQKYLDWAVKIFNWMNANLIFANGTVKDSFGNESFAQTYTYNQGVWIGACLELYKITGDQKYYNIAMKTADYVVNDIEKFSPHGILYNKEASAGGDGGLFKGIFMRYLSQWILSGKLDQQRQRQFTGYFIENGKTLIDASLNSAGMFGGAWFERRQEILSSDSQDKKYDYSIHLSAIMLLELLDEMNRKGFLPPDNMYPTLAENIEKKYKYYRLDILTSNEGLELARWQLFATQETGIPLIYDNRLINISLANNRLILTNGYAHPVSYTIVDLNGRVVSQGNCTAKKEITLYQGIYIITVKNNGKNLLAEKFIIG